MSAESLDDQYARFAFSSRSCGRVEYIPDHKSKDPSPCSHYRCRHSANQMSCEDQSSLSHDAACILQACAPRCYSVTGFVMFPFRTSIASRGSCL
nr:hypothetical protein CFP56_78282 [Quercus suber]